MNYMDEENAKRGRKLIKEGRSIILKAIPSFILSVIACICVALTIWQIPSCNLDHSAKGIVLALGILFLFKEFCAISFWLQLIIRHFLVRYLLKKYAKGHNDE